MSSEENLEVSIAIIKRDVEYTVKQIDKIENRLSNNFVTQEEFMPVKKLVYGVTWTVIIGVVGAFLALVLR